MTAPLATPSLAEVLHNRAWQRKARPFPHVVATNVFFESYYQKLAATFARLEARGLSQIPSDERLSRNIIGYDAFGFSLNTDKPFSREFGIFTSRCWHDMLAGLLNVEATGHINCGLHHHAPVSQDGWVHNDLNPGWFAEIPGRDGIIQARHALCSYTHGTVARPNISVVEVVRAVAMIFYLNNGPWPDGHQGATGLYTSFDQPVRQPVEVVAPIDNSVLVFECTPFSFHAFIGGNRKARNSVIMWLHRPKDHAVLRWGQSAIRDWSTPRRQFQ
jgi:2OG-Fe(II) oxygenase superfamily